MGIEVGPVRQHWNYFLALEGDLVQLSRYLEPATGNFSAYSLELARILITAAAEVDVVSKLLCKKVSPNSKARNIQQYRETVLPHHPELAVAVVDLPKFGLTLRPWDEWTHNATPYWWQAYNQVKHQRNDFFANASLKNALNAVSGLFVLLLCFYREEGAMGALYPDPVLLSAGHPFSVDYPAWGRQVNLYTLTLTAVNNEALS